jgi:hypothetical protein
MKTRCGRTKGFDLGAGSDWMAAIPLSRFECFCTIDEGGNRCCDNTRHECGDRNDDEDTERDHDYSYVSCELWNSEK